MIEVTGNLWDYPAEVLAITTNGYIKKDGSCVMGRGCAKEAKNLYGGIEYTLGELISKNGNIVQEILYDFENDQRIFSFPVKNNWWEIADLDLIEKSAIEITKFDYNSFVIPRPGCGNGKRDWKNEVKPILEKYFDDRFYVIHYA